MLKVMMNTALLSWFRYFSSRRGASACFTHTDCILLLSVVCSNATKNRPSINVKYRAQCQLNLIHLLNNILSTMLQALCSNQPLRKVITIPASYSIGPDVCSFRYSRISRLIVSWFS
jgi:hypothetical protein